MAYQQMGLLTLAHFAFCYSLPAESGGGGRYFWFRHHVVGWVGPGSKYLGKTKSTKVLLDQPFLTNSHHLRTCNMIFEDPEVKR